MIDFKTHNSFYNEKSSNNQKNNRIAFQNTFLETTQTRLLHPITKCVDSVEKNHSNSLNSILYIQFSNENENRV